MPDEANTLEPADEQNPSQEPQADQPSESQVPADASPSGPQDQAERATGADPAAAQPSAEPDATTPSPAAGPEPSGNALTQEELDALSTQLNATGTEAAQPAASPPRGNDIDQSGPDAPGAEVDGKGPEPAAAAGEEQATEAKERGPAVVGNRPVEVSPAEARHYQAPELRPEHEPSVTSIDMLDDVQLDVKIELGRTEMYIEDVLKLGVGSVVELDKLAGDPVDIYVNERLVARGEVLVLNDNFCVRINDIDSPVPELESG